MPGRHGGQHARRWFAPAVAAVVVAGSVGLAAPAVAAQPEPSGAGTGHARAHTGQGHGHAARGHAHAPSGTSAAADHEGSGVNLPRPNDFQAQADPDGMENGGVDQPGGTGGIDPTTQDGNNGSGNDADCEDDNRGVGVPGHCKPRPEPIVTPPAGEEPPTGPVDGTDEPVVDAPLPTEPEVGFTLGSTSVSAPASSTTAATTATAAQGRVAAGPTVLPNTGAGAALFGLTLAAVAALVLGAALARQGRRAAHVTR